VGCRTAEFSGTPIAFDPDSVQPLDIVDLQDVWATEELRCPTSEIRPRSIGDQFDEASIRQAFPGIRSSDTVRVLGYPEGRGAGASGWGVIRDDELIARFDFLDLTAHDMGWTMIDGVFCEGTGVGAQADGQPEPAEGTVLVLNGTNTIGLAAEVSSQLASAGFDVLEPGLADARPVAIWDVYYVSDESGANQRLAVRVAEELGVVGPPLDLSPELQQQLPQPADVVVVIGRELSPAA
jgi:hypothetical protein